MNGKSVGATDVTGTFSLNIETPGLVQFDIKAEKYFPARRDRVELKAGITTELEFELEKSLVVQEDIVVTGTGTEATLSETPIRTELIPNKVMEEQVKTTLAQALQGTTPGVRVEMNCQNCGFTAVRLNGMEGPYTQILENGLPSYSGVASVYGLDQIPTEFLERIEVVKGGSSSLYGPNAVAGVINLISKEPVKSSGRLDLLTDQQYGRPENEIGGSGQVVNLPGKFSANAFYRFARRTQVDRDDDSFSDIGRRTLNSGGFGLYRSFLADNAHLSVNGTVIDEFRRGGDQFDKEPQYTWITEQIATRRYTGAVTWNHAITPKTYYNVSSSLAYLYRHTYYGSGMDPNAFGTTRDPLWVSNAQLGHQAGSHTLLAGMQYNREFVDDRAPAYDRRLGGLFSNIGVFLQDEWRAASALTLVGGIRIDKSNQLDRYILSPRFGAKYGLTKSLTARASISTGFRAPAVFDEDLHVTQVSGKGMLIQNSSDLKEERSLSVTSGLDYTGSWDGKRYKLGGNFFWTRLSDNFQLEDVTKPEDTTLQYYRINGTGAVVKGVELDGEVSLAKWLNVRSGFTFQTSRMNSPQELGETHFFRSPDRYGYVGFDLELPKGFEITSNQDITGSMIVVHHAGYIEEDRLESTQSFVVSSFIVSKYFKISEKQQLRWFARFNNAFDQFQPDLDKGPNRDSSYVYGPSEMRNFAMGITWTF